MDSERDDFTISGPRDVRFDFWENKQGRMSVMASLVKGVKVLERDRQHKRLRSDQSLAPPWWESFNFKLKRPLVDDKNGSIYGAFYELKLPPSTWTCFPRKAPRYVIAFRGTNLRAGSKREDLKMNFKIFFNKLECSRRFPLAMEAVRDTISKYGAKNVWLAGHSMGSAIALLAGKNMMKKQGSSPIKTYLFNPPFVSFPLDWIKSKTLKDVFHLLDSSIKGAVVSIFNTHQDDSFSELSSWSPKLFVNPSDPFCSRYITYFEDREKYLKTCFEPIADNATKHSTWDLLTGGLGRDSEALHLIPSAKLTITNIMSTSQSFKEAHGIRQWWSSNNYYETRRHQYSPR